MKSALEILPIGTYFYFRKDSLYYLFQLLKFSPNQILVQTFWSTTNVPSMEKFYQFDVKSACSEFDEEFDELVEIGKAAITENQLQEITQFLKIKTAKAARESGFMTLKQEAMEAFEKGEFQEAIRLFSLAAPYSKYDIELYEKRGLSYLKTGQYVNALTDFDYYLIQDPGNELVQSALELAKNKLAKGSK